MICIRNFRVGRSNHDSNHFEPGSPVSFWTLDTLPAPGGVTMRRKRPLYLKARFREVCKDTGKW